MKTNRLNTLVILAAIFALAVGLLAGCAAQQAASSQDASADASASAETSAATSEASSQAADTAQAAADDTSQNQGDVQYVLYLGTNDKDSDEPVHTPEQSKEIAKNILIEHFGGYTIQDAEGGWIGDDGTEYQEYTMVIYLSDTTLDDVHAVCDVLIKEFNQSSILIQTNQTTTEFYAGA